jgi:hypothetical protein
MRQAKCRKALLAVCVFVGLGSAGCVEVVDSAARSSLTSFLTTLATTAITEFVNGQ